MSFASVHQAIKGERVLRLAGINADSRPTPREISISCGQCLLLATSDQDQALAILKKAGVVWSKLYSHDKQQRLYELLAEYGRGL